MTQCTTTPAARPSAEAPRLRRRTLATLVTAAGAAALMTGCGPSPVATSSEIPRDPLTALDPKHWDGRTIEEVRALPVQGDAAALESWGDLGSDESALDPVRDQLTGYVRTALLDPAGLSGLEDSKVLETLAAAAPSYWDDGLTGAWGDGLQPLYAFAPAEGFRSVGRPLLSAEWLRTERDGSAALALGIVVAWTVINTSTHDVGVVAYQLAMVMTVDAAGKSTAGSLRVAVHGLDGCASDEQGGKVVPAITAEKAHRDVQKVTTEQVLTTPRIPQDILLDEEADLFDRKHVTYLGCA